MSPETPEGRVWTVEGTVDSDLIANLGLPFEQLRKGATPPVVSERNIMTIRRLHNGAVARNEADPSRLWDVQFHLPVDKIYDFLESVWRPSVGTDTDKVNNLWHLARPELPYRDLPEKLVSRSDGTVLLRVVPKI